MKNSKWTYLGDVNMLDYGGKNSRCIGNRKFQFIELINMEEACGRDNEGQPKYNVSLRLVDLNTVSQATIDSAIRSCGWGDDVEKTDSYLAEVLDSYGAHAPLENYNGNNARKLLRQAHSAANDLLDPSELETALDKPVNKIGSSAREFASGDFMSAIQRGCESGSTDARIMAKMHGVEQTTIDDIRPSDWLPYLMGYMCAMNQVTKETDPDTAPEYFRGFERGNNVRIGNCPAPGWIKSQQLSAKVP